MTPRFTPPDADARLAAIGSLADLAPGLVRAFTPGDDFMPLPEPRPGDWLAEHREAGQDYRAFAEAGFARVGSVRRVVYLWPLEDLGRAGGPELAALGRFAAAFFALKAEVLDPPADPPAFSVRKNLFTGGPQLLSTDILVYLAQRLPSDAACLVALTMNDLYPHPRWNFVFGQASLTERVGVFSFARYHPGFNDPGAPARPELMLRRCCRVLAHETSHMFGLEHCVHFHCLMNGSNHLAESDARPMHLCPVCLRKLQHQIGFDPLERYRTLAGLHTELGFDDEAAWMNHRLEHLCA